MNKIYFYKSWKHFGWNTLRFSNLKFWGHNTTVHRLLIRHFENKQLSLSQPIYTRICPKINTIESTVWAFTIDHSNVTSNYNSAKNSYCLKITTMAHLGWEDVKVTGDFQTIPLNISLRLNSVRLIPKITYILNTVAVVFDKKRRTIIIIIYSAIMTWGNFPIYSLEQEKTCLGSSHLNLQPDNIFAT